MSAPDERRDPPMPSVVTLAGTVRQMGRWEVPVARVTFADYTGDERVMDFPPEVALDLLVQLAQFVRQTGAPGRG